MGRKGKRVAKSIGTFSLKEITEELKKKQSAIAAGLVVEGAKVVCTSMAGNPTDSRMAGDSDGEMYLGAFVFNMQKSIILDQKILSLAHYLKNVSIQKMNCANQRLKKGNGRIMMKTMK